MKKREFKTMQNLNRGLAFLAFVSGYLLSVLDNVYNENLYHALNSLSSEAFLAVYITYVLVIFSLMLIIKKGLIDSKGMEKRFTNNEYFWNGTILFVLGFFAGFVTLIGNALILISIPFQ